MKIGNVTVSPCEEILVLPRTGGDIIITAKAIVTMDDFDKLVPEPKAPGILTKDGWSPDENDESYQKLVEHRDSQRLAYMIIKSLEPSNVEWSNITLEDPNTWLQWRDELKEAGISDVEVNRIAMCVMQANSLDEEKLKAAREVFLRGRAQ